MIGVIKSDKKDKTEKLKKTVFDAASSNEKDHRNSQNVFFTAVARVRTNNVWTRARKH